VSTSTTILAYHAVGDCPRAADKHNLFVSTQSFSKQMDFLARRRQVIDLDTALDGGVGSGAPAVAITFDDGYRNVLNLAAPILERHGFPATVFIPTAYIGGRNTWIDETPCDVDIMSEDELRSAERVGLRMESHGHAHIDYRDSPPSESEKDLKASLDMLASIVNREIKHFAYPFGSHSESAHEVARKAGVRAAYTIDEPHGGDFAYERVQITPDDGTRLFALKTSGRYMKLRHGRAARAAYGAIKPVARRVLRRR
jgi:peptidoglycan/xylan/chitin deacetylase (PgdA/CDA1 family)